MAITPNADKDAFWWRIRGDPVIQYNMGIENVEDSVAANHILKRRQNDDDQLDNKSRYIFIFDQIANELRGPYVRSVMEIDVLMPAARQWLADETLQQIIALCGEGWHVNGREVEKVVIVGELASAAGFYRCGVRFYYYSCTKTEKRKT